jgi:type VI secretion system protein ImpJ
MQYKVVWKEGLFLRPQHFQQNDRYFSYELAQRTRELIPNAWGLFDLQIDSHYLSLGKIVLKKVSGVLPDGTFFELDSSSDIVSLEVGNTDSLKAFYLALPVNIHDNDEIRFLDQKNILTRFIAKNIEDVPNVNSGENSHSDVLVSHFDFKILFEEDVNEGYSVIKLGTIGDISASGGISLDTTYLPTYLHLHQSKELLVKLKELINTLKYRTEKLSEKLSDSSVQSTELGDYLMLQLLNKAQSRLYYYMSQDRIHPADIFLELSSLASELAVFMKKEKRLLEEFTYNYEKQSESFNILLQELENMLSLVLEQNSIALPIQKQKYGIYTAKISEKSMVTTSSFILAIKADIDSDKLKKLLLANLKVGSIETIRDLVNYHLAGFKLKSLASAPRQIPYKVNYLYFQLEINSEDKEKLMNSGGFAFHLSGELPNVVYTLWAIRNN